MMVISSASLFSDDELAAVAGASTAHTAISDKAANEDRASRDRKQIRFIDMEVFLNSIGRRASGPRRARW